MKVRYLRRAVDDESEVLDILVQSTRDRKAALKFVQKLRKRQGYVPDAMEAARQDVQKEAADELVGGEP